METKNLILIEQLCVHHTIELSFIESLQKFGLIEVVVIDDNQYLSHEHLKDLERMIRLHYELNINIEGIDAITNLQTRIADLQQELLDAKNKLRQFDV